MTGPHMLAKVAYDEHYNDIARMMADLGKLLRHNFKLLAAAGCKHIQIDEPLFTMSDDSEVAAGGRCHQHGDRGPARRHARLDAHLPGQLRGRQGIRRPDRAPLFRRRPLQGRSRLQDRVLVLSDRARHDAPLRRMLGNRQLGVGAVDVQDPKVETGETVAARIRKYGWLAPEQTIVTSSCGLNHLPRQTAFGKLRGHDGSQAHSWRLGRDR